MTLTLACGDVQQQSWTVTDPETGRDVNLVIFHCACGQTRGTMILNHDENEALLAAKFENMRQSLVEHHAHL